MQAIAAELHAKSAQLAEKEREAGEVQGKLEAEVAGLRGRLGDSQVELEKAQGKMAEVCGGRVGGREGGSERAGG